MTWDAKKRPGKGFSPGRKTLAPFPLVPTAAEAAPAAETSFALKAAAEAPFRGFYAAPLPRVR